jgi:ribosome-binding protein aMBF1 (putative translation factor)
MPSDRAREAIKKACEQKGWNVMDLARKTEISPEAIRRFIAGRGEVSTRVIVRMAKALDLDMSRW